MTTPTDAARFQTSVTAVTRHPRASPSEASPLDDDLESVPRYPVQP